ncbi:MAG: aminopeptidase N [Alphaproteobacteria bacterium]|nr:aminopeptidase N [Alphaproteobacteria bacterium]
MPPAPTIRLADYTAPAFLIDAVHLTFHLSPETTRVLSRISFRRNPDEAGNLVLNGEELTLISASIDGKKLAENDYTRTPTRLTIKGDSLPDTFIWQAEVEVNPKANTSLSGLYMSKGMYCSQCEAEGFRKITFYPDRPDVMAVFTVRIEGDVPVLLSNGNPTGKGDGWAEWHDPWPKPAYLFALVAGDLVSFDDDFTCRSGRKVDLKVWVRPGDQDKCAYAMDSLKRSMTWDEETYGREYDLDLFQIVAVDDFNMGAMENKGLNIFNSKYVLASPETATDRDFELIEGIIAHEYFHNWTGNRITCRDWFQLSLKEGLTVYRDQIFSGDQRSHAVRRIGEVNQLRAQQFREDAGPLAHPVQPAEYKEINNFYTATIYKKGAEVIGMLRNLVGADAYRKALDLYFERHDGQACTIDDWLQVFADSTGRDLAQFRLWYSQAGTPRLSVKESWQDGRFTLTFSQSIPDTPGQTGKKPMVIPIALGLLNPNGDEVLPTQMLEMTQASQSFSFDDLATRPIPSILRGFSAPVILEQDITTERRIFLLAHDTDAFNKWEAGRDLARDLLCSMSVGAAAPADGYLGALRQVIRDDTLDPAFRALVLALPAEDELAKALYDLGQTPDPTAIYNTRRDLSKAIAQALQPDFMSLYKGMATQGPYDPNAADAGKRALQGAALAYLSKLDGGVLAHAHYGAADNMTGQLAALTPLLANGLGQAQSAAFYEQWQDNSLVIDKWFMLQIGHASPETAIATARDLAAHKDFDWQNPNRFRALIAGLSMMNQAGFHDPSGAGYAFLADWLIRLDPVNAQTTARMVSAFDGWRWYDAARQNLMRAELERIAALPGLSTDSGEMVDRILKG